MIDNITFKGPIRPVVYGIASQFDQVAILRNSVIKTVPTTSYRNSPVTGAQIETLPSSEERAGVRWGLSICIYPTAVSGKTIS